MTSTRIDTDLKWAEGHKVDTNDRMLCIRMMLILRKEYPGHLWTIWLNSEQGVAIVKNQRISSLWGWVIHLKNLKTEKEIRRKTLHAGGELLERAWMKRGVSDDQNAEKVDGLPIKHQPMFNGARIV